MLYKYYRITYHQTDRIAQIFGDLGVVCLASVAIPSLFNDFNIFAISFGIILSLFFLCLT